MVHARTPLEAAQGALLGLACGDAAGGVLEFSRGVSAEEAAWAMTMPGGGCWRLGKGQFTDDTELALSLANGLLLHQGTSQTFPADKVAQQYIKWFKSRPFDIGNTTRNAFSMQLQAQPGHSIAAKMTEISAQRNAVSKSNGALMRAAPLAIFGCHMPVSTLAAMAEQDACLSHPNKACQSCNAAYVVAIAHLITHPGDRRGAIDAATAVAAGPTFDADVRRWLLEDSHGNPADLRCHQKMGFCRWGFTLAFMFLRKDSMYQHAVEETLLHGGDTDTNAAIVGGLLGALWGAQAIPESMSKPVIAYAWTEQSKHGRWRPEYLQGSRLLPLAKALLSMAERLTDAEDQLPQDALQQKGAAPNTPPATQPAKKSWACKVKSLFTPQSRS